MLAEVTYNIANSLLFVVPFAYLDKKHVHIFIDNKEINSYIWQTNTSILLEELSGKKLLIKRNTPLSDYSFRFIEATALTAEVLNIIYLQHLYVLEELNDLIAKTISNPELIGNLKLQIDKLKAQEKAVNDNIKKIKELIQNTNKNIADKIRDNNKIVSKVNALLKKVSDTLKEIKKIHGDITSKNIYPLKIFNADSTKHIVIAPDEAISKNYNLTLPEDAPKDTEFLQYDASKSSFVWAKPTEEKKEFIELNSKSGHQVRIYPAANLQKDMKINLGDDVFKLCSSIDKTTENKLTAEINKNKKDISDLETSIINEVKELTGVDDGLRNDVDINTAAIVELKQNKAEIATQDEANNGNDDSKIVTPKKLKTITDNLIKDRTTLEASIRAKLTQLDGVDSDLRKDTDGNTSDIAQLKVKGAVVATETTAGVAEIATQNEANNGNDDSKIVTPKKLKGITDNLIKDRTTLEASIRAKLTQLDGVDSDLRKDTDGNTNDIAQLKATETADIKGVIDKITKLTATDTGGVATLTKAISDLAKKEKSDIAGIKTQQQTNTTAINDLKNKTVTLIDASESAKGVAEVATQQEATDGTDDSRIVTPKKLKVITSDLDSRATRIRNDVDKNTADLVTHRTDIQQNTTAINDLKNKTVTLIDASESTKGVAEIATQDETNDGNDDSRIVTPKKLKVITSDLDSRATRIKNDVARNTADLVTHRTDIQQNTTDIVSNTASIATIITTIKKEITTGKLAESFTVPSVLHDKIQVNGEDKAGHYGYTVAMNNNYLAISDPVLQEVVIYQRDKNNKKIFNIEDVHKGKKHGAIFVEDGQVYVKKKDGVHLDVFEYDENQTNLTFKKVSTINLTGSFGKSLAIDDEYLIVGNPQSKTVLIYKHSGIQWQLVEKLSGGTNFGSDVAINHKHILVSEVANKKVEAYNISSVFDFSTERVTGRFKVKSETYINAPTASTTGFIGYTVADDDGVNFYQVVMPIGTTTVYTRTYTATTNGAYATTNIDWFYQITNVNALGNINQAKNPRIYFIENNKLYVGVYLEGQGEWALIYKDVSTNQIYTTYTANRAIRSEIGVIFTEKDFNIIMSRTNRTFYSETNQEANKEITDRFYHSEGKSLAYSGNDHAYFSIEEKNGTKKQYNVTQDDITPTCFVRIKGLNGTWGVWSNANGTRPADPIQLEVVSSRKIIKHFKTLTGGASFGKLIDLTDDLSAFAEPDNNILKIYKNLAEIASKTVKADSINAGKGIILATSKTDKKAYIYDFYSKAGWFTTKRTKWSGLPDNTQGYTGYNIAGGQTQLVKLTGATDTYTKYKGGAWVKNGKWGGVLRYSGSKIGFEWVAAGTGKITITDSTNVGYGFGFLDASGQSWVGTHNKGFGRLNITTGKITITDRTNIGLGFGFVDASGQAWIVGGGGIWRLNTITGKLAKTDTTRMVAGFGFLDASGQSWVGTYETGTGRLNTNTGKITITDNANVGYGFCFVDTSGQWWVGTRHNGIGRFNTNTGKITITDSTNIGYGFGFLDASGQAWVAGGNAGIGRLNTKTGKITITDSTYLSYGFGFLDASGQSWVGTYENGTGRLNTNTGKITITDSTGTDYGFGFVDASGQSWIGTHSAGIGRLNTITKNQLYLDTNDGKHYYDNKELKDATKFDSIMETVAPLSVIPVPLPQANRNLKTTATDIQEQPNKTGAYVSLLGTGTATTPTDITNSTDTNFAIDNNYGDACAITTDKILITNKTDSKLAIYDHSGTKEKEIQLEAGVGSVIDATDTEAVVGSETANTVDIVSLT